MAGTLHSHYSFARLRASLVHFGIGQLLNGVLGVAIILQIARGLPLQEYGAYVVFAALIQMGMAFSMIGLDTVAAIYIPQYRMNAETSALMRLLLNLVGLRVLTLMLAAGLLYVLSPMWGQYLGLQSWETVVRPFLVLMLLAGLIDYWQRGVFQPLLKQGFTQSVSLARNVLFSSLLLWASWSQDGVLSLVHVLKAELWATSAGALSGIGFFLWLWMREAPAAGSIPRWTPPPLRAMVRMSGYNYASQVLYSLGDSSMLLLVAGRMLDLQSTAALGFCLGLYGQLLRYLPAHWLWGAIQPSLVAAYSRGRNFVQLNQQAMLIYKGSLFVVAPLVAFFLVSSEGVLNLLSHNKYGDAHWLALVLLVSVIPGSHRSVLSGLVNTVERPQAGAMGNLAALCTVPLGVLLVTLGLGPLGLVIAVAANAALYNLIVIRTLTAAGFHYRVDHGGLIKIALAVAATALCLSPFIMRHPTAALALGLMVAAGALFLFWAFWMKPFNDQERSLMNQGFGRPVFIW
jgi:O-antigen/teichoic acid export membrane protein